MTATIQTIEPTLDYLQSVDNVQLVYGQWLPANPRAVIVLLHGYSEHMGRYAHVISALNQSGYAVVALDHRGHGQSPGPRADIERFALFVDDVTLAVAATKQRLPSLPVFMLAHSMGGLIAVHYALTFQAELAGLILTSAALGVGDGIKPLMRRIGRILAHVTPHLEVVKASTEPLLSRDPDIDLRFAADPLCYQGRIKARMGHQLILASDAVAHRLGELRLPLLIMHGTEDKIVRKEASQRLYDQASSPDKTLKWWPGAWHELFNEVERDEVIQVVLDWLDKRTIHE